MTNNPRALRTEGRRAVRRRRARVRAAVLGLAGAALIAVPTSPIILVLQQQTPVNDLVDELVTIEERLTGVPLLPAVSVDDDEPWGTIRGDFIGAAFQIDQVADDLTTLVERASETDGPVPMAVRDVASAYRTMREGYGYLAAYEQAGLGVEPAPAEDDEADEAAPAPAESGEDEPRGQAEVGLDLLLEALAGFDLGYDILRSVEAAADARSLFEVRYSEVQQAAQTEGLDIRTALSYPVLHLLVPVDRFDPQFGGEPPAQVARYACVDRGPYLDARSEGNVPDLPLPEGAQEALPIPDCPNLDNGNEVRPVAAPLS